VVYDAGAGGGPPADRVVYVRARTVLTPYLFVEERPRRITGQEREVLEELRDTGEEPTPRAGRIPRADGGAHRHRYDCQVRFSDVDIYRHVNNVKYYEYIQEARIDFLLGLTDGDPAALSVVVRAIDVDYARPVVLRPEPYAVESWVHHVGTSSFVVISEIRDSDVVLARARAVVVAFDPATSRSTPLTEDVRDRLTAVAG
jgi:acyl-CoA thioester hydrolase